MNRRRAVTSFLGIALALTPHLAHASIWTETTDAGDLPATAQETLGVGDLTDIYGYLASSDQDMFLINITNPGAFSASTNNVETDLTEDDDTQLFLFDVFGLGILANDDHPDNFKSQIAAGSFAGPAGNYLLGISTYDNDPVSIGGEIFPDTPYDHVVGPTGPGGGSPITGWNSDPNPLQSGSYRIALEGASFANVRSMPEPTTWAVWSLLGLTIGGAYWFRRGYGDGPSQGR